MEQPANQVVVVYGSPCRINQILVLFCRSSRRECSTWQQSETCDLWSTTTTERGCMQIVLT